MNGSTFAADLKKIRESRGISINDLHDETKIPRGLIESFEDTGLIEHPMFNRVYLRSFVRTYAEVIGISPEVALASLDESMDGGYRGRLAIEYLGAEPSAPAVPPEPLPPSEIAPEAPEDAQPVRPSTPPPPVVVPPVAEPEPLAEPPPPVKSGSPVEPPPPVKPVTPPPPEPISEPRTTYTPTEQVMEYSGGRPAAHPARTVTPPPRRMVSDRYAEPRRGSRQWIWLGAGIVVLIAIVALVFTNMGAPDPEETATVEPSDPSGVVGVPGAEDTSSVPFTPPVAIGDSMDVNIVSAGAPVEGIRVTVDDDLRRPYWIEVGQSLPFQAAQRIVIEEQLEDIELTLEGRPYPTNNLDEQGRIVITRESAEQFLSQSR